MQDRNYTPALTAIASMRPHLSAFFEAVMVNVLNNEKLRAHRHGLLQLMKVDLSTIADFSEIVTSGDQK